MPPVSTALLENELLSCPAKAESSKGEMKEKKTLKFIGM